MCYQPTPYLLCTSFRNMQKSHSRGDYEPQTVPFMWPKYFLYCSIILLGLILLLSLKTLYFASYPVTIGNVNGSLSLAVLGYCLKLNVPNSNGTSETCSPGSHLFHNLSLFKFLLSTDLIFNAAVER